MNIDDLLNSLTITNANNPIRITRNKGNSLAKFIEDYCVIDIETTGLDPRWDDIIEISALRVRDSKVVDKFTTLVIPENFYGVSGYIRDLTGITSDMIASEGLNIKKALEAFLNFIKNDVLVGHNINFDINFLYDNIKKFFNRDFSNDFIDTLRIARHALPQEKHHRLKDLAKIYKIDFKRMHRGLNDSIITKGVFDRCRELLGSEWNYTTLSNYQGGRRFDARTIVTSEDKFDKEHLFFDKNFVFTGKLEHFTRSETSQIIADIGAHPQNGINKETNFLVVGSFDYVKTLKDGLSGKQKKAIEKKLAGQDIQILTEDIFLEQL